MTCFGADEFGALGVNGDEADRCERCVDHEPERSCRDCVQGGGGDPCLDCSPAVSIRELNARQVAVGGLIEGDGRSAHTCVLAVSARSPAENELHCFGSAGPRLGLGALGAEPVREPRRVTGTGWSSMALAHDHGCALDAAGTLSCWGRNDFGKLGLGDSDIVEGLEPRALPGRWSSVSAGRHHACAIQLDGRVSCWGDNRFGQLGLGDVVGAAAPQPVEGVDRV
ncbi:MAG: hypothetical protein AAF645_07930, partial [Myxococcota bacterium]